MKREGKREDEKKPTHQFMTVYSKQEPFTVSVGILRVKETPAFLLKRILAGSTVGEVLQVLLNNVPSALLEVIRMVLLAVTMEVLIWQVPAEAATSQ